MEATTNTEKIYNVLDEGAELLKKELDLLYIDALGHMGENMFQGQSVQKLSDSNSKEMELLLKSLPNSQDVAPEEYRRAVQLAALKGMKEATQPHHAMTPDAVGLFIGYLVNKLLSYDTEAIKPVLMDPAVGSGNLMTSVMNQVEKQTHFIGAEPDETLLRIAYVNANLQKHSVDLFHHDSVNADTVKDVDLIVSDLPLGYYPNDQVASKFETVADKGHSYVHHLLIEQAMTRVKKGGFLVFIVPNQIFQTDQSKKLHSFIKKEAVIYSFMQLPDTMFKSKEAGKSILILRKNKQGMAEPKQALLAELPSFSKEAALADMMKRISAWLDDHLKIEKNHS
ncbi:class I SAM-dependent methyltransferase [Salipaludibacillus sp. CF4.18]|uniref:class I SAM-dependent methyltransferase n=1 Tax=Salipaludibacillus sp. CF4.18 TaxID=3373081 RepID=UPI003EE6B513